MKYSVDTLHTSTVFTNVSEADQMYNALVKSDKFTYVELKEIVSESPNYYAKSIKIFWK